MASRTALGSVPFWPVAPAARFCQDAGRSSGLGVPQDQAGGGDGDGR